MSNLGSYKAQIHRHLVGAYPELCATFRNIGEIDQIRAKTDPVPESVVRVVAGQMLSRQAAGTIYRRIRKQSLGSGLAGSWELSEEALRACGLSRRKAQSINLFAGHYRRQPNRIDGWKNMDWDSLSRAVCENWGMSEWTASILAMFYFGHEDVYPNGDGSLKRAERQIGILRRDEGYKVDHQLAKPFRSYLALYLWKALDEGHLSSLNIGPAKD